jgi:hypothetical protein
MIERSIKNAMTMGDRSGMFKIKNKQIPSINSIKIVVVRLTIRLEGIYGEKNGIEIIISNTQNYRF